MYNKMCAQCGMMFPQQPPTQPPQSITSCPCGRIPVAVQPMTMQCGPISPTPLQAQVMQLPIPPQAVTPMMSDMQAGMTKDIEKIHKKIVKELVVRGMDPAAAEAALPLTVQVFAQNDNSQMMSPDPVVAEMASHTHGELGHAFCKLVDLQHACDSQAHLQKAIRHAEAYAEKIQRVAPQATKDAGGGCGMGLQIIYVPTGRTLLSFGGGGGGGITAHPPFCQASPCVRVPLGGGGGFGMQAQNLSVGGGAGTNDAGNVVKALDENAQPELMKEAIKCAFDQMAAAPGDFIVIGGGGGGGGNDGGMSVGHGGHFGMGCPKTVQAAFNSPDSQNVPTAMLGAAYKWASSQGIARRDQVTLIQKVQEYFSSQGIAPPDFLAQQLAGMQAGGGNIAAPPAGRGCQCSC